jgi:hypothetical protein
MRALSPAPRWTVVCTLLAFGYPAAAQCVDRPLPTSASTRALGMGNANVAGRDDDVIFYGPAQLAVARGTSVAAERYFDGLAGGTAATTSRLASGGIGVGAQIVEGKNSIPCLGTITLPNGDVPARTITRTQAAVGAALTFRKYRFGVATKYAAEQIDVSRLSQVLVDVGISRDYSPFDFVPLTLAVAVQNLAPNPDESVDLGMARRAVLGAATGAPLGPFDLALAGEAGLERNGGGPTVVKDRPVARGGIEIGYSWLDGYSVAVRAGGRTASTEQLTRYATFGAGLVLDRLAFDYATEQLIGSRFAHRFGIRLR